MFVNRLKFLGYGDVCAFGNYQTGGNNEITASDTKEKDNNHVCKAGKKPIVVNVRIEKNAGGGMGKKHITLKYPDGHLETVTETIPIVQDVDKKPKDNAKIVEKKIERGEQNIDYLS